MSPYTVIFVSILAVLFILISTIHLLFNQPDVDSAHPAQR